MKHYANIPRNGYSIVELMVAVSLSSLLVIVGGFLYLGQSSHVKRETEREAAALGCQRTFDTISRLLRQANGDNIAVRYDKGKSNGATPEINDDDEITVDFSLPSGYAIWPNDVQPYERNWTRLAWSNRGATPYSATIASATSRVNLNNAQAQVFAGNNGTNEGIRIVNIDLDYKNASDNQALAGWLLTVSARTNRADTNYENPGHDADSSLKHFRTCTLSGLISPRNNS